MLIITNGGNPMANKNTAGNLFKRAKAKETKLVEVIDKRDKKGANDNTYSAYDKFRYTPSGERVWSF
jgi:hypothetical protein